MYVRKYKSTLQPKMNYFNMKKVIKFDYYYGIEEWRGISEYKD